MRKALLIFISLFLILLLWQQYRHFYDVNHTVFTVWKRESGKCLVMPYAYYGLSAPKEDYLITPNLSEITICLKGDSLIIFDEDFSECSANDTLICFFNNYKFKYIHSDDYLYLKRMRQHYLTHFTYITISCGNLNVDKVERTK